jgi:predicted PurR-regulated permease PerM
VYKKLIPPIIACLFLALLGWLLFRVMSPLLPATGWALVISVLTFGMYQKLRDKLGGRSNTAASLMIIAVTLILVIPSVMLAVSLSKQATEFYQFMENLISTGNHLDSFKTKLEMLHEKPVIGDIADWILEHLSALNEPGAKFPQELKTMIGGLTRLLSSFISNAFRFLLNLLLALFALFVFYTKGEKLLKELVSIAPLPPDRTQALMERCCAVINLVFKSVVLTALAGGLLGGLGLWVTGLPSPVLFGSLTAISTIIPYIGTAFIWIPACLYLFLVGDVGYAVGLLLWFNIVVSNIDNVMRPLLFSGDDVLPVIPMLVGVLGGMMAFGLSGLFIGPISLVIFLFVLEEHHREKIEPKELPGELP